MKQRAQKVLKAPREPMVERWHQNLGQEELEEHLPSHKLAVLQLEPHMLEHRSVDVGQVGLSLFGILSFRWDAEKKITVKPAK